MNKVSSTLRLEMTDNLLKVLKSFRVTLPKSFRDPLKLKIGDYMKFEIVDNELRLVPVKIFTREKRLLS